MELKLFSCAEPSNFANLFRALPPQSHHRCLYFWYAHNIAMKFIKSIAIELEKLPDLIVSLHIKIILER